ncbi:MAG: tetratricopeptide repeat protein [Gemmatimonadetes bacterium]|nr:tetratricopeptide repeat protein [Gemmatimonadota bacterium]
MLRDVDALERALWLRRVVWTTAVGALAFGAGMYGVAMGMPLALALAIMLVFAGGTLVGVTLIPGLAARLMSKIYAPGGSSTPGKREHSYPESLAARGQYEEAIHAYEAAAHEFPHDPEPCLRAGRLLRDELGRHEDAIAWFKRGRFRVADDDGRAILATQEIVDIYLHKLGDRRRAIPELARLVEALGTSPAGCWTREQLAALKAELRDEEEGS